MLIFALHVEEKIRSVRPASIEYENDILLQHTYADDSDLNYQ